MKIEVYSDVVCPWCYIGKRRLERALAGLPAGTAEVVYRPFQLDPGAPRVAEPVSAYLKRRFGAAAGSAQARVSAVAEGEGITMVWDRMLAVNTLAAHRLLRLAELEYGREVQQALAESLFAAHFTHGLDVADPAELTRLAESAGMDAARVSSYLASGEGESEVRAAIAEARALGVQAVPTFVFDGRLALEGAQPLAVFQRALEEVGVRSTSMERGREGTGSGETS